MTNDEAQEEVKWSPADRIDLDLIGLQKLTDYITVNSTPKDMTIVETQEVMQIFIDWLNGSLHNLNVLRQLNGEANLPIPASVRDELMK